MITCESIIINRRKDVKLFMSKSVFLRKLLMAHIKKIYRFMENTTKMTFPEKNKTFCVKIALFIYI